MAGSKSEQTPCTTNQSYNAVGLVCVSNWRTVQGLACLVSGIAVVSPADWPVIYLLGGGFCSNVAADRQTQPAVKLCQPEVVMYASVDVQRPVNHLLLSPLLLQVLCQ